jgi:sugar/nucleoside kinase (ribokinase family)
VIVVIGQPALGRLDGEPVAAGSAARMALAAAARGASVQLVGKVGEDPDGEALVLALARGHVGHVAVQRDPAHPTPRAVDLDDAPDSEAGMGPSGVGPSSGLTLDAADVELALRYLTEFRIVVLADELDPSAVRVAADATGWANGTLVAVVPAGRPEPAGLPADAIVLGSPGDDADGAFDRLVGELAAAIDAGADPQATFRELVESAGWEPAPT